MGIITLNNNTYNGTSIGRQSVAWSNLKYLQKKPVVLTSQPLCLLHDTHLPNLLSTYRLTISKDQLTGSKVGYVQIVDIDIFGVVWCGVVWCVV